MAHVPGFFGEMTLRRVCETQFGSDLPPPCMFTDVLAQPVIRMSRYVCPCRNLPVSTVLSAPPPPPDVGATIKSDRDKFQVNLDVQHFSPDEITVKIVDGYIVVEGKHEEIKDEHGFISRQFKRRYALPAGCKPEAVESRLSSDGVLSVVAPKEAGQVGERDVPIAQTGPIRRRQQDERNEEPNEEQNDEQNVEQNEEPNEEQNGDVEGEARTPQKRRRH